ncbi:MAG: PEP-CTERM sorting domain-containing protein [Puniceicoccales bacterium]
MKSSPKISRVSSTALISVALTFASQANAAILGAWDDWADAGIDGTYDADFTAAGFTASLASQNSRINSSWSSTDGTYGNVPGAPTDANGAFLTRATGTALTLAFTLTNNTGFEYNIESFNFDFAPRSDGSDPESFGPNAFTLTYTSGGLETAGTEIASESGLPYFLTGAAGGDPNANGNYPDYSYSLSPTLSSIVLADGESATFTLVFSGASGSNASNVSSMVDNVAFTGSIIPEPSTYAAMLGISVIVMAVVRRKRQAHSR